MLLIIKSMSNLSIIKDSESIIRFTQLSYFAIIIIIGASMIVKKHRKNSVMNLPLGTLIFAIGFVPCPATLIVLNYLLLTNNDLVRLIIATLSIGLGISVSLTIFSLLSYRFLQTKSTRVTMWTTFMIVFALISIIIFTR